MAYDSPEMACNVNGDIGVARVCEADAGDALDFVWRAWPDGREPGSITRQSPLKLSQRYQAYTA